MKIWIFLFLVMASFSFAIILPGPSYTFDDIEEGNTITVAGNIIKVNSVFGYSSIDAGFACTTFGPIPTATIRVTRADGVINTYTMNENDVETLFVFDPESTRMAGTFKLNVTNIQASSSRIGGVCTVVDEKVDFKTTMPFVSVYCTDEDAANTNTYGSTQVGTIRFSRAGTIVTAIRNAATSSLSDGCVDSNTVQEYICSGGTSATPTQTRTTQNIACSSGFACNSGQCIPTPETVVVTQPAPPPVDDPCVVNPYAENCPLAEESGQGFQLPGGIDYTALGIIAGIVGLAWFFGRK